MVVVAVDVVIADGGKGCPRFVEISGLQCALGFRETSEAAGEAVGGQFTLFARGMAVELTHHGMTEFVGENRKCSEIAIACIDGITEPCLQINGVIAWAIGGCRDATVWACTGVGRARVDDYPRRSHTRCLRQALHVALQQVFNRCGMVQIPGGVGSRWGQYRQQSGSGRQAKGNFGTWVNLGAVFTRSSWRYVLHCLQGVS